jgi:hypothetical protein
MTKCYYYTQGQCGILIIDEQGSTQMVLGNSELNIYLVVLRCSECHDFLKMS